jgi:AcrR family transcriptional regulator
LPILGVRRTLVKVNRSSGDLVQLEQPREAPRRRLNRDRVLRAAVALADESGIDALSMRKLAEKLGVVPMALYKHVAGKEELLDGMVDIVVGEIDPPVSSTDWKRAVRQRILSARRSLRRHPWAPGVIESLSNPSPVVLAYIDSMIGMLRAGGFSIDLTHHALHAMGSRLFGFTQEVFNDSQPIDPETSALMVRQMEGGYPHIAEMLTAVYHDEASIVGQGCDDQFEFEFALDLLLDGLDKLRQRLPASTE